MSAPGAPSESAEHSGAVAIRELTKAYDETLALDAVSLDVAPGEFVTFLGPSGSGKTTTLRIVAGFTDPDGGEVSLDGRALTGVPPYKRDIGMVFQSYALFPHMTAAQNLAFPLQMRGTDKREAKRRVDEALELVHLEGFGERYPSQLSGGQQQRVALARAIVFQPRLLLMDEPLGALDKKLREALQIEIRRISNQLGVTVIYVTHDQEEALAISDRIAIFRAGRIEQIGTGEELYERPTSYFVADFMGESNIFRGRLELGEGKPLVATAAGALEVSEAAVDRAGLDGGSDVALVVRPERMEMTPASTAGDGDGWNVVRAEVADGVYLGSLRRYELALPGGEGLTARVPRTETGPRFESGQAVEVRWRPDDGVVISDSGTAAEPLAEEEAGAADGPAPGGASQGAGASASGRTGL